MKELFAVDITNGSSDSEKFVVRKLSESLMKKQVDFTNDVKSIEKSAKEPGIVGVIRYVCILIGLFLLVVFFASLIQSNDLKESMQNGWIILAGGIIFGAVGVALMIAKKAREKRAVNSKEYEEKIKQGENIYDECIKNLKIPKNAKECDVFISVYENKKGELKPATKMFNYVNTSIQLFSEGEYLMIADLTTVFGIKKSCFKGYKVNEKSVSFNCWNKNLSVSDKEIKPFGVRVNAVGFFSVKNCCNIELEVNGEQYFIVIPPYDSENFLKVAGIKNV